MRLSRGEHRVNFLWSGKNCFPDPAEPPAGSEFVRSRIRLLKMRSSLSGMQDLGGRNGIGYCYLPSGRGEKASDVRSVKRRSPFVDTDPWRAANKSERNKSVEKKPEQYSCSGSDFPAAATEPPEIYFTPYFLRNLSTRPAVSTSFTLPV